MSLFLLVVLLAVALGIIGVVIKGLLFLLIIGIVVFLLDIALAGYRRGRTGRRQVTR